MPKVQVVSLKPMEGISKEKQRPYKMLIVGCLFTNDDGTVEMGEIVFMDRPTAPIPTHLVPGQSYTPLISASSRQGRLQFEISELKPMVQPKPVPAAA